MNIKFSIGIPAYKPDYLKECIDSVINQSYLDLEIIIIDDDSPNNLKPIIDQFTDSRIIYRKNDFNIGAKDVVHNWNKCLQYSSGDFFILMGDDDRMEPTFLEEFYGLIIRHPDLDVFHCRTRIIDSEGNSVRLTPSWPEFENVYDSIWHRITLKREQYISDFVYRSSVLKDRGGFYYLPLAWGSDDITSFIACGKKGIAHTNAPVFNYRSHSTSITSTGNILLKLEANTLYHNWIKNFLLTDQPTNDHELITYKELLMNSDTYIRKKNLGILTTSLNGSFKGSYILFKGIKKYHMSFKDFLIIVLNSFRRRFFKF